MRAIIKKFSTTLTSFLDAKCSSTSTPLTLKTIGFDLHFVDMGRFSIPWPSSVHSAQNTMDWA